MPEYLDDPSVLTKEKLKSELLAHNVVLPSGNPTKDVYVQLYLTKLAGQSRRPAAAAGDSFSSDDELPPPALPDTSRSSGRKATRKTDKVRPIELDVTALSDKTLRDELLERGLDVGPIVASTRKLYEKKLQKLLDEGPPQPPPPQLMLVGSESDLYSDREDEVIAAGVPEPVEEPEPAPVVERTVRSREKTVTSTRSHSSKHTAEQDLWNKWDPWSSLSESGMVPMTRLFGFCDKAIKAVCGTKKQIIVTYRADVVEKIAASDQTLKVDEKDVLKKLFLNDRSSPTGITATCRRPIRGAAGRPVASSDLWSDSLFSPKATKTSISSYTQSYSVNRVSSLPPKTTSSSLPPAVFPAGQIQAAQRSMSLWIKLFLLAIVATFLFLIYQAMETTSINPFQTSDMEVAAGSTA